MPDSLVEKARRWGDVLRLVFFVAGIIAAGALAWASRDSRIVELEREVLEHERRLDVGEQELRDLRNELHMNMTELKAGLATLLERTKNMGQE